MIVNEISLVIQKIFSVKQPKDQRFQVPKNSLGSSSIINSISFNLFTFQERGIDDQRRDERSHYLGAQEFLGFFISFLGSLASDLNS